jgi:hypothetical protein
MNHGPWAIRCLERSVPDCGVACGASMVVSQRLYLSGLPCHRAGSGRCLTVTHSFYLPSLFTCVLCWYAWKMLLLLPHTECTHHP